MYAEAKVLKVQEHLDMICTHFLATSFSANTSPLLKSQWNLDPELCNILSNRDITGEAGLAGGGTITDTIAVRKQIHTKAV